MLTISITDSRKAFSWLTELAEQIADEEDHTAEDYRMMLGLTLRGYAPVAADASAVLVETLAAAAGRREGVQFFTALCRLCGRVATEATAEVVRVETEAGVSVRIVYHDTACAIHRPLRSPDDGTPIPMQPEGRDLITVELLDLDGETRRIPLWPEVLRPEVLASLLGSHGMPFYVS